MVIKDSYTPITNAAELRIGNWISVINLCPKQVDAFHIKFISEGDDQYAPIPLTEEWLIKFGFDKKYPYTKFGNGQDWQPEYPRTDYKDYVINEFIVRYESFTYLSKEDKPGELITMDEDLSIHQGEWYEHFYESVRCPKIQYIHQLQNLYFALTGEELTIKDA